MLLKPDPLFLMNWLWNAVSGVAERRSWALCPLALPFHPKCSTKADSGLAS